MKRILFVCHGNICRSPMAEFIFKDILDKAGLSKCFYIASAATSSEELGNPIHPETRSKLAEHKISSEGKYAVQLSRLDYPKYDYIIGMDVYNIKNIIRILGGDPENKVHKLLDFADGGDVADPWYTLDFDTTYSDILKGCTALFVALTGEKDEY